MKPLLLLAFIALLHPQVAPTVHYYTNGQMSLQTKAIANGQLHIVYNRRGEEVVRQEDHRSSYSVHTTFRFHANGGVSRMKTHTNPGGSRYWYDHIRLFSEEGLLLSEESQRNGLPVSRITYHYDQNGNRTSETHSCWPTQL
jgi:hypothetical protein